MSYHRLARISRETDGVADVIYHAGENYMQAQDPRVNLKLFYYYVFFHSLKTFNVERKLQCKMLLSLELLSGIHAS